MRVIVGERILVGEPISIGSDGKAYRCSKAFKGKIPSIAEKEKRGKKVKIPPSEIYVQELAADQSPNINAFVKSMDLPKSKSYVSINIPPVN